VLPLTIRSTGLPLYLPYIYIYIYITVALESDLEEMSAQASWTPYFYLLLYSIESFEEASIL
jgi:hypothetical protein